jgi:hypothetical protein
VTLVKTDVSEERTTSITRVTRIWELRTMLLLNKLDAINKMFEGHKAADPLSLDSVTAERAIHNEVQTTVPASIATNNYPLHIWIELERSVLRFLF